MKQQLKDNDTVVLGSSYNDARAATAALVERLEGSLSGGSLDLPSLPEVAMKIRRALADENVSVSEIARLLGTDPALAARTLRIANSAMFYRGSRPITSLSGAVSQLGYKMVRNVAYRSPRSRCSSVTTAGRCATWSVLCGGTACTPPSSATCSHAFVPS